MHRQHCITVKLLFACACFLMGCAEASEADGNSCPPAGASGKISYVQVGYQQCNSDMPCFEPYAGKTSCPGDAFRCGIDASLNYYCTDGCRPGSVLCNDLCIDPLANSDFCGADLSCRSYERCSTGEVCVEGKCVLSSFSNCSNGEKRCNVNNLELCLNGIWRPSETCLGSTPVCDQVARRCVSSSNTKQSCAIQNITIVDSDSRCIGSTLVSCQDGSVIETPCTTTNVANADPSCDQSEKKCAFTCRDGFHKASDKCVLNCVSSICGNGEIQICGSDGALQAAKACPQIAHAKQYGGCSEDGKRCLVTDCETGFTPSSSGDSCVQGTIQGCSSDVCQSGMLKRCQGDQLQTAVSCSSVLTDSNQNEVGCNSAGTACEILSCKTGYTVNSTHTLCVADNICTDHVCDNNSIRICSGDTLQSAVSCMNYIADANASETGCNTAGNGCIVKKCRGGYQVNASQTGCSASSPVVTHSTDFSFVTGTNDTYEQEYSYTDAVYNYTILAIGRSSLVNGTDNYAINGEGIILYTSKKPNSKIVVSNLTRGIGTIKFDVNGWDEGSVTVVSGSYTSGSKAVSKKVKKTIELTVNANESSFTMTSSGRIVIDNLSWTDNQ